MKVRKKNEINKIDDETSIVIMYKRNGERFEALISNEDVDKVKDMSWHVGWRKYTQSYYAEFCEYLGYY